MEQQKSSEVRGSDAVCSNFEAQRAQQLLQDEKQLTQRLVEMQPGSYSKFKAVVWPLRQAQCAAVRTKKRRKLKSNIRLPFGRS